MFSDWLWGGWWLGNAGACQTKTVARVGRGLFSSCLPQRITRENRPLLVGKEGLLHDLKDPPSNYQVRLNFSREKKNSDEALFSSPNPARYVPTTFRADHLRKKQKQCKKSRNGQRLLPFRSLTMQEAEFPC